MKQTLVIGFLLIALTSCIPLPTETPRPATETPVIMGTGTPSLDWFEVYFTDPPTTRSGDYFGGPDEMLAEAIHSAELTVDMAIYNLNLWSIRDALLDAWRRGVQVRLAVESDNMDGEEIQELIAAGIPVLGDRREGLMHNKFVVIDRQEVWTGSMNFTVSGGYFDDNNLMRIISPEAAETYLHEFNEMFKDDRFGTDSLADTLYPSLEIGGVEVELLFSPDDGVAERLIELVGEAQESIYFLASSFTSDDIAFAIVDAAQMRGVRVGGVMDREQANSNQGSEYQTFVQAGLDVRLDGGEGQMHHKVIIIDQSIVISGSYNFSAAAEENNDENVVILHNAALAAKYLEEYRRVRAWTQP